MSDLSFHSIDAWWWPWVFLTLGGWFVNDVWRLLGVAFSHDLTEESRLFTWIKAVATALVAGVIAKLIFWPSGDLAEASLGLRIGAVAVGFGAFRLGGESVAIGVVAGEVVFLLGRWAGF